MPTPSLEAVARHPHLGGAPDAGRLRVDMHVHCLYSGDSTTTIDELASSIFDSGIDVVCLTDHHDTRGAARLAAALADRGQRVVCGEEIRTHTGEIIGLFVTERIPFGLTARETAIAIRDQGGIVYVPHPFDPMRRNITEASLRDLADEGLVDAIEVINAKTSLSSLNGRARQFALDFGLAQGAGSDGHVPLAVGAAFAEIDDFVDAQSFLAALRTSTTVGHHWDEPRPWSPRIVPAT